MCNTYNQANDQVSKYWKNKPIMKLKDRIINISQICSDSDMEKFKKDTWTNLPNGYQWEKIDICHHDRLTIVCDFLTKHYRRASDSEYIIKYDPDRINWEMCHKGYFLIIKDINNDTVGVIGFTYRTLQLMDEIYSVTEPMYICCEKKYRGTGIAKVLMDETIRQSLMIGINKGIFCNNRIISKPIATIRQYSRPLNYKKLREHDFVEIGGVDDDVVHYKTKINLKPNRRYVVAQKTQQNIDLVYDLYKKYMITFNMYMILTKYEIENYMFDEKHVKTIIVMNEDNKPVDFITYNFYDIIDTNKKETDDNIIKAANILMYSSHDVTPEILMINVLKQISYDKIHIVYINDIMHSNEAILSNVKNANDDTDDEEESAICDMNIIKTGKKIFINLYNIECSVFKQNMVSWLLF